MAPATTELDAGQDATHAAREFHSKIGLVDVDRLAVHIIPLPGRTCAGMTWVIHTDLTLSMALVIQEKDSIAMRFPVGLSSRSPVARGVRLTQVQKCP